MKIGYARVSTFEQKLESQIEVLKEAGAEEVSEEVMLNAIMFGHEEIKRLIAFQQQIVDEIVLRLD